MRVFAAVVALMLAVAVSGSAQNKKARWSSGGSARSEAKSQPKCTVPMKVAGPKSGGSSSKQLQKVEHEKVGKGTRTPKARAHVVKADKESRGSQNSKINFNGSGGKGTGLNAHNGGSLKGRLKEIGKGKQRD